MAAQLDCVDHLERKLATNDRTHVVQLSAASRVEHRPVCEQDCLLAAGRAKQLVEPEDCERLRCALGRGSERVGEVEQLGGRDCTQQCRVVRSGHHFGCAFAGERNLEVEVGRNGLAGLLADELGRESVARNGDDPVLECKTALGTLLLQSSQLGELFVVGGFVLGVLSLEHVEEDRLDGQFGESVCVCSDFTEKIHHCRRNCVADR